MKKRILAMLLTVCMLVLAVPVFTLPAAAEEPAYATKWTDNIPAVEAFVYNSTSVEWPSGWSFVSYNRWQTPGVAVPQGQNGMYWVGPLSDEGNWGGFMSHSGKYTGMNYGNNDKANRGSIGSILAASRTCDETITDSEGKRIGDRGGTAGIRYTAEKAGVLNIYFDKLGNDAENVEGNFTYYLYVNGELVKTWTLEKNAGAEEWIYDTKTLVAEGITVRVGTVIEFLCDTDLLPADNAYGRGGNCLFANIEYTETNDSYITKFNSTTNIPTIESDGSIAYHGNWQFYQYHKENNNGAGYYNTDWRYKACTAVKGFPGGTQKYLYGQFADKWGAGMLIGGDIQPNHSPAYGVMYVSSAVSGVLRYTAEKSGSIDIILDKVGNLSPRTDILSSYCRYGIFVNGTMVWPVAGGTLRDVPELGAQRLENVEAVKGLYVSEGDHIEFIVEGYKTNLAADWAGAANVMFPTIIFTGMGDNVKIFDAVTNLPVINEDKSVSYKGNFFPIGYEKGEDGFDYSDPDAALLMDTQTSLWGAGNGIAPTAPHLAWANKAHMVLKAFNGNYFNQVGQICVTGLMSGGLRYVAEETGTVKIDFASLGNTAPMSGGIAKFNYLVYVNGEKVWETDGATWDTSIKANVAVADGIDLSYGDVVDFIVEGDGVGDADPWTGAGNVMFPIVTWTKIIPKPTTSVNVALTSSFALNAKVEIPVGVLAELDYVGFLVNGEDVMLEQTDINAYAINNIIKAYVQDLASETVTIQAYYVTLDGRTIMGTEITTNIIEVIQAYVGGADEAASELAKATLNYISEAQMYFDPNLSADDLANAILTDEDQDTDIALDFNKYDETILVENPNATVDFAGVSMVLNSAMSLKFYMNLPENADLENYAFIALDPVSMGQIAIEDAMMIAPLKYTEDGAAIAYFGSTFENMDRLYAFVVIDETTGLPASDILVYSPLAYAANMVNDLEVGYVCSALIALDQAIDAYTGAVATR